MYEFKIQVWELAARKVMLDQSVRNESLADLLGCRETCRGLPQSKPGSRSARRGKIPRVRRGSVCRRLTDLR